MDSSSQTSPSVRPPAYDPESMVEKVARALFLAEHPRSEWSAGRARIKWWALAEAAIEAIDAEIPA